MLIALAGIAAIAGAVDWLYRRYLRRWVLTWGATEDEAALRLPGDELLDPADIVALDFILRARGITTIALGGFLTNCCVESTMRTG